MRNKRSTLYAVRVGCIRLRHSSYGANYGAIVDGVIDHRVIIQGVIGRRLIGRRLIDHRLIDRRLVHRGQGSGYKKALARRWTSSITTTSFYFLPTLSKHITSRLAYYFKASSLHQSILVTQHIPVLKMSSSDFLYKLNSIPEGKPYPLDRKNEVDLNFEKYMIMWYCKTKTTNKMADVLAMPVDVLNERGSIKEKDLAFWKFLKAKDDNGEARPTLDQIRGHLLWIVKNWDSSLTVGVNPNPPFSDGISREELVDKLANMVKAGEGKLWTIEGEWPFEVLYKHVGHARCIIR
jgi:hypothetical protein